MLEESDFYNSKPAISRPGFLVDIETFTNVSEPDSSDRGLHASPQQFAVKFKSREAVMDFMEPLGASFNGPTSCKLVNEVI